MGARTSRKPIKNGPEAVRKSFQREAYSVPSSQHSPCIGCTGTHQAQAVGTNNAHLASKSLSQDFCSNAAPADPDFLLRPFSYKLNKIENQWSEQTSGLYSTA